ncbi:MAG: cyclic nucleotide-binding domain-containing protein [Verrucomicrobiota bacterium]|nr:cyclic nucleotide-binding domain-containing protein [Verrucomicrobiota bacterium]
MSAAALQADAFETFSTNRLFDGIRPDLLREVAREVQIRELTEGEVIFREGDPGDSLYLIGEGSVQISKLGRGGNQETLAFIKSGNFFGEMALLDGEPRSAMATAAENTILGTVTEQTFQHILELAPNRLHMNFLRSVSERLRHVNSHFITEVMRTERLSLVGSMANTIIHDLKNPICIVRCCADLISTSTTDPRLRDLTSMLNKAVEGMLSMTQELLDYARGSTELKKESVSMWRLLDELNQQVLQLLPGQNVQFVKHVLYDGMVEVDVARFTRVLCNLIKNAREAMPDGGILAFSSELAGNDVILRLSDTGCGIPAEIIPRLFEPFVTHGKSHGTGLGMAIAKSVIEAHQGTISVKSVQGNGTTVEIRLPAPSTGA